VRGPRGSTAIKQNGIEHTLANDKSGRGKPFSTTPAVTDTQEEPMRNYETTVLLPGSLSEQQVEDKKDQLRRYFGDEAEIEDQGVQKLAYKIKHNRDAHYLLVRHRSEPVQIDQLRNKLKLDEEILRHLIIAPEDD
jgi:small subunit ribosomal protein S6